VSESPNRPRWVELDRAWYLTSEFDQLMYPANVAVVEDILARGGDLRTVIDVGAHVGFTAIPCARHGATVWAYECNPWTFGCLSQAALHNNLVCRLYPVQAAVAPGPRRLAEVRSFYPVSGMSGLVQAEDQVVVGRAVTIDFESTLEAAGGPVDFLKIDIEGGEHELIPAVPRAAWGQIDWLHVEDHDVTQPKWHAPGAKNCDWRAVVGDAGFEEVAPALWRRRKATYPITEAGS
jgi:FkbM family methyltransferase